MADGPVIRRTVPLVMISRPVGGTATAHLCGPATGTICGLPSAATHQAITRADELLLELMVKGTEACPVCATVVRETPSVNPGVV